MKIIKNTLTIFFSSIFIVPNISGSSLPENISELVEDTARSSCKHNIEKRNKPKDNHYGYGGIPDEMLREIWHTKTV